MMRIKLLFQKNQPLILMTFAIILAGVAIVFAMNHYWAKAWPLEDTAQRIYFIIFLAQSGVLLTGLIAFRHGAKPQTQMLIENSQDIILRECMPFFLALERMLGEAKSNHSLVGVVRLNIDHFKQINANLGYTAGDEILRQTSTRLHAFLQDGAEVAWFGGDEFAAVIPGFQKESEVENYIKNFHKRLREHFELDGAHHEVSFSFGVAIFPKDGQNGESLVLDAETAMKQAQRLGGDQYKYFTEEINQQLDDYMRLKKDLRDALQKDEFRLVYQPKVDATTGMVKGFEALLRWTHPQRGAVSPVEFIPVLEDSGQILPVGEWVIRETCMAIRRWTDAGLPVVPVSVNVSMLQFKQEGFTNKIDIILKETNVSAAHLEVELTESCLMDDGQENIDILNQLKAMGVSISIDDFGTGYSSLSYLKRFPIDTLKIDRSFITNVHNRSENDNASIVTAIMALSHSLRLNVVAEGVETAHELAFLHALGCRTIQGFLFSKPLTEQEVNSLLKESSCMAATMEKVRHELSA